jgi:hypothetical protein
MKALFTLLAVVFVATAHAEPLRLILVPQQIVVPPGVSAMKFDVFLYNPGKSARTVPSLEEFRAFYTTRRHTNSDSKSGTEIRAFSHPIKDHTLKAQSVDHTVIAIDLSSENGDYIELRVEIGHDERTLTSNLVLLLCSQVTALPAVSPASPEPAITPN